MIGMASDDCIMKTVASSCTRGMPQQANLICSKKQHTLLLAQNMGLW